MNDLDFCLEVDPRLLKFDHISKKGHVNNALHSTLNISEAVRDRGLVLKDHK